jgi:signal transduction histidine kinase
MSWNDDMEKVIRIRTFEGNGRIGFEIGDSGIGIDTAQIEQIFELGKSSKTSSGFGLYYSKLFVEACEGTISIASPGKGKGTTATVIFPLVRK